MAATGLRSYFMKVDVDPGVFIDRMNAHGGYDEGGQLRWWVLEQLWPGVELVGSAWTKNHPGANLSKLEVLTAIDHIQKNNRRGQIVGICVDNAYNDKYPDHIVLAVETPDDLNEWTIMDPDGGRIIKFKDKYVSPLTGVYGYRILAGTPANFPPDATPSDVDAGTAIGLATDDRYTKKDVQKALMGL
jgi:hypothetical protein